MSNVYLRRLAYRLLCLVGLPLSIFGFMIELASGPPKTVAAHTQAAHTVRILPSSSAPALTDTAIAMPYMADATTIHTVSADTIVAQTTITPTLTAELAAVRNSYLPIIGKMPPPPENPPTRTPIKTSPRLPDAPADAFYVLANWSDTSDTTINGAFVTEAFYQGYYADVALPSRIDNDTKSIIILAFGRQRLVYDRISDERTWGVALPRTGIPKDREWVIARIRDFLGDILPILLIQKKPILLLARAISMAIGLVMSLMDGIVISVQISFRQIMQRQVRNGLSFSMKSHQLKMFKRWQPLIWKAGMSS